MVEKHEMQRRLPENVSPNDTRTIAVEDIERGFVQTRTGVNEVFDFSPPANATVEARKQAIGGCRPAEERLKDRKGRALAQDDLRRYQRIILALAKTRETMNGLE